MEGHHERDTSPHLEGTRSPNRPRRTGAMPVHHAGANGTASRSPASIMAATMPEARRGVAPRPRLLRAAPACPEPPRGHFLTLTGQVMTGWIRLHTCWDRNIGQTCVHVGDRTRGAQCHTGIRHGTPSYPASSLDSCSRAFAAVRRTAREVFPIVPHLRCCHDPPRPSDPPTSPRPEPFGRTPRPAAWQEPLLTAPDRIRPARDDLRAHGRPHRRRARP